MQNRNLTTKITVLLIGLTATLTATADNSDEWREPYRYGAVTGSFLAELDLSPIGIPRIEAMALSLHRDGTVSFISEHEPNDLSSSGIGVWKRLPRQKIGIGLLMYRMSDIGFATVCHNVAFYAPDNCVLRVGASVKRESRDRYSGTMLLTIEGPVVAGEEQVVVSIPIELPFSMHRIDLEEFPVP